MSDELNSSSVAMPTARAAGPSDPSPQAVSVTDGIPIADERAALIWALHFFALYARDCDSFKDAPRGAWMWSEQFAYKQVEGGEYEFDDEPRITERLPDDLHLLGVNHEFAGGCYAWGLPMKLFRRAAELINQTGGITQYTAEQQAAFKHWLWNGGNVPSLSAQGIEAGTAETGTGSVHESPVACDAPKGDTHDPSQ